jgi:hypothetical protein
VTLIAVALLGDVGLMLGVPGADGAIESCVKLVAVEQDETFPAASVAVAVYDVVALAGAVTEAPVA